MTESTVIDTKPRRVEGWRAKPVGWCLRQTHIQMLTATQTANGSAPLPRLVTGIKARPLPGVTPAIANRIQAKVDDMNESTRTSGPNGSGTPAITVKITPVLDSVAPVTTTHGIQ